MNAPATAIQFDPAVHPSAALFPMLPPDELQELADSIAANGLQQPIVMQGDVLIDGRNRLAACRLAGVEPSMVQLEGDADAFILGANINRRHMGKGQRAMVVAMIYPQSSGVGGRGKTASNREIISGFSPRLVQLAQAVLRDAPTLAAGVLAGATPLAEAAETARQNRAQQQTPERRLEALGAVDEGLADRVRQEQLSLAEAEAIRRAKVESERAMRAGVYDAIASIDKRMAVFAGAANLETLAAIVREFSDKEDQATSLRRSVDSWLVVLTAAKEALA